MLWSVRVLGGLSVKGRDGREVTRLRTRKVGTLLAYLALRGGPDREPLPRERLCAALWPDADEATARHNLSNSLTVLRAVLEPPGVAPGSVLEADRHALRLRPGTFSCDAAEFERRAEAALAAPPAAAGRRDDLCAACALYAGPLLGGVFEEDWASEEAARLSSLFLRAAVAGAEALLEAGDGVTALALAERAVAEDPLLEGAVACLMRAHLALSEPSPAYAAFRRYERRLRAEVGDEEEVPPALHDLAREARRLAGAAKAGRRAPDAAGGTPAPPPPPSPAAPLALTVPDLRGLPAESAALASVSTTRFFGREAELRRLSGMLAASRTRMVTVTGPGGTGKTRLTLEAVAQDAGATTGARRSLFVPLADVGKGDDVPAALLRALGVKPDAGARDLRRLSAEVLAAGAGAGALLLLLDNFEQLVDAGGPEELTALLTATPPAVKFLVTSRVPLRIVGEHEFRLSPLATTAGATAVDALSELPAVALFVDRAQMARPEFELTEANAADVAALVDKLEGIPLAIELAAARSGVLTPAQMLAQIEARPLDGLRATRRDIAPRHASLRAALEWSAALLPPEALDFLADLSVFRGGWSMEAAQAVSPDRDALEMLTLLRDASLVNVADNEGGLRFSLLETVRQFAEELLARTGRADAVRERHHRYFQGWCSAAFARLAVGQESGRDWFVFAVEREYPNLVAALTGFQESGRDPLGTFAELCHSLLPFWEASGRHEEGCRWLELAVRLVDGDAAAAGDQGATDDASSRKRRWDLLGLQADLATARADWEAAATSFLRVFELCEGSGDPLLAKAQLFNAAMYGMRRDIRWALDILEHRSLPLERQASADGRANPFILGALGSALDLSGEPDRAAAFLAEALNIAREREQADPSGYRSSLMYAADAARARGDAAGARGHLEAAVRVTRRVGDRSGEANALCGLAALARDSGDQERGGRLLAEAEAAAGPEPSPDTARRLQRERAERLLAGGDAAGAAEAARRQLAQYRGRARGSRLFVHPLLLLAAEADGVAGVAGTEDRARTAARLLGAADAMAERLGLIVPPAGDRARRARLHAALLGALGQGRFTAETAAGAALDDEGALEFALREDGGRGGTFPPALFPLGKIDTDPLSKADDEFDEIAEIGEIVLTSVPERDAPSLTRT